METLESKKERLNSIKLGIGALEDNRIVQEYLDLLANEMALSDEIKDLEAKEYLSVFKTCDHLFFINGDKTCHKADRYTCIKCGFTNFASYFDSLKEPYISEIRKYILEYFKDFNPAWLELYISKYFDSLEEARELFGEVNQNKNTSNKNEAVSMMLQLKQKKGQR